jgi:outer membrane protein
LKNISFEPKKGLWFMLLLICFLGTTRILAQPETLTLSRAIDLALKADYQVITDINNLEKARLAVKKEALNIFPEAAIEGQYQYKTADDTYPNAFQIIIKETIPTPYNLYGQKIVSSIEATMWDQVLGEATLQIDKADVIYNTYKDYINVLTAQQVLKLQAEVVAKYKEASTLAEKQLSLGKITKPDQLKIANYLNQAEYDLEKDRSDLEIALEVLANQIGLNDLSNYILEEVDLEPASLDLELSALQKKALQRRLEVQMADINLKKAQRIWAQKKNSELPALSFSYNNQNATQSFGLSYDFLSGDFSWLAAQQSQSYQSDITSRSDSVNYFGANQSYFTLKLSWAIDFGSKANESKQAQYSLENAKLDLEKERRDILLEVKQALADYHLAVKQYQLNRKSMPYYEKDLEIKELQEKLGVITCTDLSTARQNELEAAIAAVKSEYNRLLALQKLKMVVGDLYPFDHPSK